MSCEASFGRNVQGFKLINSTTAKGTIASCAKLSKVKNLFNTLMSISHRSKKILIGVTQTTRFTPS